MPIDYTAHLRADGEAMADAVARDLDAHVPTCPEWNAAKLAIHTGIHHRWVADAVRKAGEPPVEQGKPGLRGDELVEWFRQGWRDLADLLDHTDDDTPAWTWSSDRRVGFWRRRTALETLVHRWDAENATGVASALDPELAADGVDEMLFVMVLDEPETYHGTPVHLTLEAPDAGAAWTLELADGELPRPERGKEHAAAEASAAVSVTAPAEDLLLFLWGRRPPESVRLDGDGAARDALLAWMDL